MAKISKSNQLEQLAQVFFKEDSKRIPTELLPLMVVFGLIALLQGIASRILKEIDNGKSNK